jgi:hypothetical protein
MLILRGRMLGWSPDRGGPMASLGLELAPWSGAPSPYMGWRPPSHCAYKREVGARALGTRFAWAVSFPTYNPNPDQEIRGAASNGKHRRRHCTASTISTAPPFLPRPPLPWRRSPPRRKRCAATGSNSNTAPPVPTDGLFHLTPSSSLPPLSDPVDLVLGFVSTKM